MIVDFYSDGCGPCRQMAPIYKRLAKELKGKAVFTKVEPDLFIPFADSLAARSLVMMEADNIRNFHRNTIAVASDGSASRIPPVNARFIPIEYFLGCLNAFLEASRLDRDFCSGATLNQGRRASRL